MNANSCIIRGGSVVCADRVLPDHDVVIVDGRIAAIEPVGAHDFDVQPDAALGALPVVDARGAYVTPGLIDVHSDYVENVASPRPSVVMDLNTSLYKADRELVSHGITTIFPFERQVRHLESRSQNGNFHGLAQRRIVSISPNNIYFLLETQHKLAQLFGLLHTKLLPLFG